MEMGIAWLYCEPVDMCLCVALSHLSVHAGVDVYGSNLRTCDFAGLCVCSGTCIYLRGYARPDTVFFFVVVVFHFLIKSDTLELTQSDTTAGDSEMNPMQLHAQLMPLGGSGFQVSLVKGRKWKIKQQHLPPGTAEARPGALGHADI